MKETKTTCPDCNGTGRTLPDGDYRGGEICEFCKPVNMTTDLKPTDRVRVKENQPMPNDKAFAGMAGHFVRYARTGFAIVVLDALKPDTTMIHPENLEAI